RAGVKVAINTDDSITESRFFLRTGAIAVRGGMPEDAALRALTIHGAQMLHLDHRLGSLEKGKNADFVVLSGPPFSVYTTVLETSLDGVRAFKQADPKARPYQVGGFALAERERLPKADAVIKPQAAVKAPLPPSGVPLLKEYAKRFAVYAGRLHTVANGTIN